MKHKHDLYDFTFLFTGASYPARVIESELDGLKLNGSLVEIDEYGDETPIAKVTGHIYLTGCDMPILDWLDAISEDTSEFMYLFRRDGYPIDEVEKETLATDIGPYLFLTSLVVEPSRRGKGLGLITTLETIKVWGRGADFVAIKPFPLQFANEGINDFTGQFEGVEYREAQAKLIAYYERIGFSLIQPKGKSSGVMVLSSKYKHPDIENIVEINA
jgi:hypothetical protein